MRADAVSFRYGNRSTLQQVSVELGAGELLGIVGPNGAGKTTLLNVLSGYLHAQSGSVELGGRPLHGYSRRQIARQIAVVPQRAEVAFSYSVREVVLMGRHPYAGFAALDTSDDLHVAADSMLQVGLGGFEERGYDQLSGGEQRLVLVARALAQQTPILMLDEPLAELDLRHQFQMLTLLKTLAADGKAILATFHDLNAAARWCDRVILLADGTIRASGIPGEVLRPELLHEVYGVALHQSTTTHLDFV